MTSSGYSRVPVAVVVAVVMASLLAVVMMMWHANPASATIGTKAAPGTNIKVTTKVDELNKDRDCSLREAIEAANTNSRVDRCAAGDSSQRDAIHFSLGKKATITLGSQLPIITDTSGLVINGQRAKITVSGGDSVRVFFVNRGAKLTLVNLKVTDGFAATPSPKGAGLFNNGGTVKVINSTFSDNTVDGSTGNQFASGGAIENVGTLTVMSSTFSGNSATSPSAGSGIHTSFANTVTVVNSTFSGNSASSGGGIFNPDDGTLTVSYSTFSGNSASAGYGAAIYNNGSTTMENTVVANSTQGDNCGGSASVSDGGYNLDDGTSCGFSSANNSMPSTNPLLDPNGLANNGGPTKTIRLLEGSPAINTIPEATNGCGTDVRTDQRGVTRPQGEKCDTGAFEQKMRR